MAKTYIQQYQPISTAETSTDDALSVRFTRDTARNINNYRVYAGAHKLCSYLWNPRISSIPEEVDQRLVLYLGRWWIPDAFNQVRWWLTGKITNGTDETTWTLCCSPEFYYGPESFNSGYLSDFKSDDIVIDSTDDLRQNSAIGLCRPNFTGHRWFYLLAENDTGDTSPGTTSEIVALDMQPIRV